MKPSTEFLHRDPDTLPPAELHEHDKDVVRHVYEFLLREVATTQDGSFRSADAVRHRLVVLLHLCAPYEFHSLAKAARDLGCSREALSALSKDYIARLGFRVARPSGNNKTLRGAARLHHEERLAREATRWKYENAKANWH